MLTYKNAENIIENKMIRTLKIYFWNFEVLKDLEPRSYFYDHIHCLMIQVQPRWVEPQLTYLLELAVKDCYKCRIFSL